VLDVAVELGFVKKAGAWFTYEGEQMGQGRENVKTFLRENPQMMAEIDGRVRERIANELLPDVVEVSSEIDVDVPISLD
jgi:recombination protein RecA